MARPFAHAPAEGVIQFRATHTASALSPAARAPIALLDGWRRVLVDVGGVGAEPARYGGVGFGNLSARLPPWDAERGRRAFVVTGTQTGAKRALDDGDWAVVASWRLGDNAVVSSGPALPSSESLTHAALYDLSPTIRSVVHAHLPALFRAARRLGLPHTDPAVGYGTVEMAREVARLWRTTALPDARLFVMAGHEDGVVAFGRDVDQAAHVLLSALART